MAANYKSLDMAMTLGQTATSSHSVVRKMKHSKQIITYDASVHHGESPKGVPVASPHGVTAWIKPQEEGQQPKQQQQQQKSTGGGQQLPGGEMGEGNVDHDQPRGESAIMPISYIGSRHNPMAPGIPSDPRHQLMLEDEQQGGGGGQQQQDEEDTKDQEIQLHLTSDGGFWSTEPGDRKKKKIRLQIVEPGGGSEQNGGKEGDVALYRLANEQQQQQGQQGGGSQQKKFKGQRPLFKRSSTKYIEVSENGAITLKYGDTVVVLDGSKAIMYFKDETKSVRVDNNHTHIRCGNNRIWVDESGCYTTKEIVVRQDPNDG